MDIIFSIIRSIYDFFNDNPDCIKYLITAAIDFKAFPFCQIYRTRFRCGLILITFYLLLELFY